MPAQLTSILHSVHHRMTVCLLQVLQCCRWGWQAKCVLEGETRMVHLMGNLNYAEVLQAVRDKFPQAGPFILKYLDRCVHSGC